MTRTRAAAVGAFFAVLIAEYLQTAGSMLGPFSNTLAVSVGAQLNVKPS